MGNCYNTTTIFIDIIAPYLRDLDEIQMSKEGERGGGSGGGEGGREGRRWRE